MKTSLFLFVITNIFSLALYARSTGSLTSLIGSIETQENSLQLPIPDATAYSEFSPNLVNAPSNIDITKSFEQTDVSIGRSSQKTKRILANTHDLNFTRGREEITVALGRAIYNDKNVYLPKRQDRILKPKNGSKTQRILAHLNTIDLNQMRSNSEKIEVSLGRALYFDQSNSIRDFSGKLARPSSNKRVLSNKSRLSIIEDLEENVDSAYGRSQN